MTEENIKKVRKRLLYMAIFFAIFCILVITVLDMKLPLPENEKGQKIAVGKIESCDIRRLGRGLTAKLYVGIQLADDEYPYLRLNTSLSEREEFKSLCKKKAKVKIVYHANRILIRPKITYFIDHIEVVMP